MSWQEDWTDRFYRSRAGWRDGTTEFHELCSPLVTKGGRVLEVGAGPANATSAFLATLGEVHGIDVSAEALHNEHLTSSALVGADGRYPYDEASFDVAVSNYVVEHVADPRMHLAEIARVLKPDSRYVFRTPNLAHYVALVSWLTPDSFHKLAANRLRAMGPDHHDPWPTVYAMNTPASVRRFAGKTGFEIEQLRLVEKEPSYGMYARPLFLAFMAYERLVNASQALAPLRANMLVVLRKRPRS